MLNQLASLTADCERSSSAIDMSKLEPLRGGELFVTGVTGFVGLWISVFAAHLNDKHNFGLKVTGIARHERKLRERAGFLVSRNDFNFQAADVRQLVELPARTQWVIHAAASPDNREHATDPVGVMSVISEGTARVLKLAEQAVNIRGLLHFSSASVYGVAGATDSFVESAAGRLDASSAYGEAKRFSEVLCASARSQARIPVVITRPFTFIGPFQPLDAPWAVNNFLYAAMHNQPLKLLGDGQTTRSYLYGSDMAALALCQLASGTNSSVYNLGATEVISLRDLAELVASRSSRQLDVRYNSAGRQVARTSLTPDMTKSMDEFGFRPAFSIADAVARTQEWHAGLARA